MSEDANKNSLNYILLVSVLFIFLTVSLMRSLSPNKQELASNNPDSTSSVQIPPAVLERHLLKNQAGSLPNNTQIAEASSESNESDNQVKVILKVFPKETLFKLSMINPEQSEIASNQTEEVQLMMTENLDYELKLESKDGEIRSLKFSPSGEMEVHYIHF